MCSPSASNGSSCGAPVPKPDADATADFSDHDLAAGRLLFAQSCSFVAGAARFDQLPAIGGPEVAFAGRSNVGKSSLINALTGRRTLARTSNTPGRTQQINFFDLGGRVTLVDLPGYGYAKASKAKVADWTRLIRDYLRGRPTLARVMLLIDARHGFKPVDLDIMATLDEAAVVYEIVATKADKTKASDLQQVRQDIEKELLRHAAAYPAHIVTSAAKGDGIERLRATIAALALP